MIISTTAGNYEGQSQPPGESVLKLNRPLRVNSGAVGKQNAQVRQHEAGNAFASNGKNDRESPSQRTIATSDSDGRGTRTVMVATMTNMDRSGAKGTATEHNRSTRRCSTAENPDHHKAPAHLDIAAQHNG